MSSCGFVHLSVEPAEVRKGVRCEAGVIGAVICLMNLGLLQSVYALNDCTMSLPPDVNISYSHTALSYKDLPLAIFLSTNF